MNKEINKYCTEVINKCGNLIDSFKIIKRLGNEEYLFWPLFFKAEDAFTDTEMDSCATSIGLLATIQNSNSNKAVIERSVRAILWMRNDDGSWPSMISNIKKEKQPRMEGVINDTVFAINALLEVGILNNSNSFIINKDPKTQKDIRGLSERYNLIMNSINWILKNKLDSGWDYKGIEFLKGKSHIEAAVLPTAKIIILLDNIIKELEPIASFLNVSNKTNELKDIKEQAINWLVSIQNNDNGFGRKRGYKSTLVHSAFVLRCILSFTKRDVYKKYIISTLSYIINNKYILKLDKIEIDDIFDFYEQIVIDADKNVYKRNIKHENFIHEAILDVLLEITKTDYFKKINIIKKTKIFKIIKYIIIDIKYKQNIGGRLDGAIISRRIHKDEQFPIYTTCLTMKVLKKVEDNFKTIELYMGNIFKQYLLSNIALFVVIQSVIVAGYVTKDKDSYVGVTITTIANIAINIIAGYHNYYNNMRGYNKE